MPRDELRWTAREEIKQMTARETGRAGHENAGRLGGRRARQRGTPLSAPLKGEKFPRPASVNEMKNR